MPADPLSNVLRKLHDVVSGQWLCDVVSDMDGQNAQGNQGRGKRSHGCSTKLPTLGDVLQKATDAIAQKSFGNSGRRADRRVVVGRENGRATVEMTDGSQLHEFRETDGGLWMESGTGNGHGAVRPKQQRQPGNGVAAREGLEFDTWEGISQGPQSLPRGLIRQTSAVHPFGHLAPLTGPAGSSSVGRSDRGVGGDSRRGFTEKGDAWRQGVGQGSGQGSGQSPRGGHSLRSNSAGDTTGGASSSGNARETGGRPEEGKSGGMKWWPKVTGLGVNLGGWGWSKGSKKRALAEEAEQQERALASALASGRRATLLAFFSPRCRLCRSLHGLLHQIEAYDGFWLAIAQANVDNPRWMTEVAQYDIRHVPCFVLLDSRGHAQAKTGVPYSRDHVVRGLSYLVQSMRPFRRSRLPPVQAPHQDLRSRETLGTASTLPYSSGRTGSGRDGASSADSAGGAAESRTSTSQRAEAESRYVSDGGSASRGYVESASRAGGGSPQSGGGANAHGSGDGSLRAGKKEGSDVARSGPSRGRDALNSSKPLRSKRTN